MVNSDIAKQVDNLKATVFGEDTTTKAYSVRIPIRLSANIEAVTGFSGKSRNTIINDLLRIGLACFMDNLDGEQLMDIQKAIEEHEVELHIEAAGGK